MSNVTITFRTDADLKKKVEDKLETMGLDMTTALNLFLIQVDNSNNIPFEIKATTGKSKSSRASLKGLLAGKMIMCEDFNEPISF